MLLQQIIAEFERYITSIGGVYSLWYVGITNDPEDRLFNAHGVGRQLGQWIHAPAANSTVARQVEAYFLNLGMDGGGGGGDSSSYHVYAYRKTNSTRE